MRKRALSIALSWLALAGCGNSNADRAAAPEPAAAGAQPLATHDGKPPEFAFVAPQAWRSKDEAAAAIAPPDLAQETWRAFVNQNKPIQKKTPRWQPLPATQTVELSMPEGSGFRCIVAPLEVAANANEFGTKLEHWSLTRRFVCSGDGFRTWSDYEHQVRLTPDGTRQEHPTETGALLRERSDGGKVVLNTYVLLRTTPEQREATKGPPKIVEGRQVDD